LPVGEKTFFFMVKTGLAKNSFCQQKYFLPKTCSEKFTDIYYCLYNFAGQLFVLFAAGNG